MPAATALIATKPAFADEEADVKPKRVQYGPGTVEVPEYVEDRRREHLRVYIGDNHDVRPSAERRDPGAVHRPVWCYRQARPDEAGTAGQ